MEKTRESPSKGTQALLVNLGKSVQSLRWSSKRLSLKRSAPSSPKLTTPDLAKSQRTRDGAN